MRNTKVNLRQIEQKILFHFLPELECKLEQLGDSVRTACVRTACAVPGDGVISSGLVISSLEEPDTHSDRKTAGIRSNSYEHLHLLVSHLKKAYAPTVESLEPLLQSAEITYNLLGELFKPGCYVYTKCLGSQKSRCVVFDAGEEVTQKKVTYFKLECHYLDHDGHEFGEVGVELGIVKFRGRKPIHTLDAFPLQYHPSRSQIEQKLVERGRKFRDLVGDTEKTTLIQHCRGKAFIMKNGKPQAVSIDSRVAVDAGLFREMEPNYRRPRVSDCWEDGFTIHGISFQEAERQGELETLKVNGTAGDSMTDDDFLICCPNVRCFSFHEKMFCRFPCPVVHVTALTNRKSGMCSG